MTRPKADAQPHATFRTCASTHGMRLHRIHLLNEGKPGALQSTVVFDCTCGQRWLMRVIQGDVVSVDGEVLDGLKRARNGRATIPPGFPGAE